MQQLGCQGQAKQCCPTGRRATLSSLELAAQEACAIAGETETTGVKAGSLGTLMVVCEECADGSAPTGAICPADEEQPSAGSAGDTQVRIARDRACTGTRRAERSTT